MEIPISLFIELRKQNPDVILLHSMIFSWQILFLGLIKRNKTKILVQNHAEAHGGRMRKKLEKLAATYIDGFLFVNKEQAEPWTRSGIINDRKKACEVMGGATY